MEDLIPIVAILSVFGSITAVCVLPSYFKSRNQREMQTTVRAAIAEGQALPPEIIDVLTRDVRKGLPTRSRDIRRGILFVATGIGLALLGQFTSIQVNLTDGTGLRNGLLGVACLPFVYGLAYLALAAFNKDRD